MSQSLTNSNISSSTTINCRSASGYGDNGRYRRGSYNQYKEEKMGKINKNLPTSGITATTTNTRKNINSYDYQPTQTTQNNMTRFNRNRVEPSTHNYDNIINEQVYQRRKINVREDHHNINDLTKSTTDKEAIGDIYMRRQIRKQDDLQEETIHNAGNHNHREKNPSSYQQNLRTAPREDEKDYQKILDKYNLPHAENRGTQENARVSKPMSRGDFEEERYEQRRRNSTVVSTATGRETSEYVGNSYYLPKSRGTTDQQKNVTNRRNSISSTSLLTNGFHDSAKAPGRDRRTASIQDQEYQPSYRPCGKNRERQRLTQQQYVEQNPKHSSTVNHHHRNPRYLEQDRVYTEQPSQYQQYHSKSNNRIDSFMMIRTPNKMMFSEANDPLHNNKNNNSDSSHKSSASRREELISKSKQLRNKFNELSADKKVVGGSRADQECRDISRNKRQVQAGGIRNRDVTPTAQQNNADRIHRLVNNKNQRIYQSPFKNNAKGMSMRAGYAKQSDSFMTSDFRCISSNKDFQQNSHLNRYSHQERRQRNQQPLSDNDTNINLNDYKNNGGRDKRFNDEKNSSETGNYYYGKIRNQNRSSSQSSSIPKINLFTKSIEQPENRPYESSHHQQLQQITSSGGSNAAKISGLSKNPHSKNYDALYSEATDPMSRISGLNNKINERISSIIKAFDR